MQPEELLALHEEIDFDSKQFDDLKILFFYHQKVFDREHNHPKILELAQSLAQMVWTNQYQLQHSS